MISLLIRATYRLKFRFNRRWPYYRRCLGRTFCLRVQVYDGACYRHQEVYDRRAARRLNKARKHIRQRRGNTRA